MKKLLFYLFLISGFCAEFSAQNFPKYGISNAHSHNDYHQPVPFWTAYNEGFGSIEADVFYQDGKLLVGHDPEELSNERTLQKLYLEPISAMLKKNGAHIYKNPAAKLILFVEMKSDYHTELPALAKLLKSQFQDIIGSPDIRIIITGHVPPPAEFANYPEFIYFDGDFTKSYTPEQLRRVGMFSAELGLFTQWHGKGIMRDEESAKVREAVARAHQMGKPVRFWGAPDFPNAWVNLIDAGADYINTDNIPELARFLKQLPKTFYKSDKSYESYNPKNRKFGKKAKNVILMIPDGVSLPQFYAAFTANKGRLNIFKMPYTGLSKTNSANAYITDSAPGSTVFATGVKTKNNFVGVDKFGKDLAQLPKILAKSGMQTALMTTGDVTDATPADFFAHTDNREDSRTIIRQFARSDVKFLIGGPADGISTAVEDEFKNAGISHYPSLSGADFSKKRILVTDPLAMKNYRERGKWLGEAFAKTINVLKQDKKGFFIMAEASRTDINAHANELGNEVEELLDFDETLGKALKFADEDGQTLVIVVGDHETGGLTLLDGSLTEGWVLVNFSSNDHTALPATVFAYGPGAEQFAGFYENTEIFHKILNALRIPL